MDLYNSYSPLRRSRSRKRTRPLSNSISRTGAYNAQSGPASYANSYTTNVNGSQTAASMPDYLRLPSRGPRLLNTQSAVDAARQVMRTGVSGMPFTYTSPGGQQTQGYIGTQPTQMPQQAEQNIPLMSADQERQLAAMDGLTQEITALGGRPLTAIYPQQPQPLPEYGQQQVDAINAGVPYRNPSMPSIINDGGSAAIEYSQNRRLNNQYAQGNPGLSRKFGSGGALQGMPLDTANTRSIVNPDYKPGFGEPKYLTFHRGGTGPRQSGNVLTNYQSGGERESQVGGDFLARNYTGDGTAGPDGVHVMKNPDGTFAATSRGNLNRIDGNRNPLPPTTYEDRRSMGTVRVDDEGVPIAPGETGYDADGNKMSYEDGHTVGAATTSMPHDYLSRAIAQSQRVKAQNAERGGLTRSQERRLMTRQKTLDRSVRRGVLSQAQADKKMAQMLGREQRKVASALNRGGVATGGSRPATTKPRVTLGGSYDDDFREAREADDAALSAGATPENREDLKRLREIGRGVSGDETMLTSLNSYDPLGEAAGTPEFDQWWQTQKPDEQHRAGRAFLRKAMNAYAKSRDRNFNDPVLDSLSDVDLNDQNAVIDAMGRLRDHGRRKYHDRSWSKYGADRSDRPRTHDLIGDTNPAWGIGGL